MPWDFSFYSEKLKKEKYSLNDEVLKPYFKLENVKEAVFGLANTLYGLNFTEAKDIPGYHPDVTVYDVTDANGRHMALFYADFFPRESKGGGAWMTSFREQSFTKGGKLLWGNQRQNKIFQRCRYSRAFLRLDYLSYNHGRPVYLQRQMARLDCSLNNLF